MNVLAVIAIIILLCLCISERIHVILYKKQVRSLAQQIDFIKDKDTNLEITTELRSKDVIALADGINTMIRRHKEYHSEIKRTNDSFKQTITSISHDLRTPLTSTVGYIQMLENEKLTTEKRTEYLAVIKNRMDSVQKLITQLFEYARIEAGELRLENESVNITNLVITKLSMFYDDFTTKNVEVSVDAQQKPIMVSGDSDAFARIFENIIVNALVHGKDEFSLTMTDDGNRVETIIKNRTSEITEADIEQIFDRFYTTDKSRTKKTTGLGLSIAKQLTTMMNGEISAFFEDNWFGIRVVFNIAKDIP